MSERIPEDMSDQELLVKDQKDLDYLIDEWGADLREQWTADGRLGPDDFKGMHRTALITICRVREAVAKNEEALLENARCGNIDPRVRTLGNIAQNASGL